MKSSHAWPAESTADTVKIQQTGQEVKSSAQDIPGVAALPFLGGDGAALLPHPLLDTCEQVNGAGGINGEIDADLQKRTNRRKRAGKIADKLRADSDLSHRADKMEGCGRSFHRGKCSGCGKVQTFSQAYHCDDRLCPECARRRAAKLSTKWKVALEAFEDSQEGCHKYFFTITFRNSNKLHPYAYYTKPRRKLFKHPYWKQFGLIGGLCAFEATGKKSNTWHPHFHCVIYTREAIDLIETGPHKGEFQNAINQEIASIWQALTGDSFIVKGQTFDGNVRELVKYLVKAADELPDERLIELAKWAKGKRFISTFGALYNNPAVKAALKAEDEEETPEQGTLHECECGCRDFEVTSYGWHDKLNSFIVRDVKRVHIDAPEEMDEHTRWMVEHKRKRKAGHGNEINQ